MLPWETKEQIYRKLYFFWPRSQDGKPDGWCHGVGRYSLVLLSGQQQCTIGVRDKPHTRRPDASHTATRSIPTAATGWHLRNNSTRVTQSAQPSVTLPHPTPHASEAKYQHQSAAVGDRRSVEVSPHRKHNWFVLNVRKFFTAVEEMTLVSQKQSTTIKAGLRARVSVNIHSLFRFKPFHKSTQSEDNWPAAGLCSGIKTDRTLCSDHKLKGWTQIKIRSQLMFIFCPE